MKLRLLLLALLALAAIEPALAMDAGAATDIIDGDATTAIEDVGGSMLALAGVAVAFKWAKASIFG